MDDEPRGKTLGEYLAALKRRRWQILALASLLGALAVGVAAAIPSTYRSSATILVQEQEIPTDLVRSTITSFADERIQVISQQVMTRAVLLQLVSKFDLYSRQRKRETNDEILERMRRDIKLQTVNADITDRRSGSRVNATIAFRLSFASDSPERAQKVVNELVSLYLNENLKVRQQRAAETTSFLTEEAERVADQLKATETRLAQFKQRHAGRLPETSELNLQLAARTESELARIDREISTLQDRKMMLEAQLPLVRPTAPLSDSGRALDPAERLRELQARYSSAAALYGGEHPDVRRLVREIAALEEETGARGTPDGDAEERLRAERAKLAELQQRYSDDHPDVQRLRRSIAAREKATSDAGAVRGGRSEMAGKTGRIDNPLYVTLQSQIAATTRELAQISGYRDELRSKLRTYDARLSQIPEVDREYRDLVRDYDNIQARYREIKAKQMTAQVAQELEKDRKGERFTLIEPPQLPEKPESPNRPAIVLFGLLGSLGSGLGVAALREALDRTIKGRAELDRESPAPVLATIPYVPTAGEASAERRRRWWLSALAVLAVLLFALLLHTFVKPLPSMWDAAVRQLAFW